MWKINEHNISNNSDWIHNTHPNNIVARSSLVWLLKGNRDEFFDEKNIPSRINEEVKSGIRKFADVYDNQEAHKRFETLESKETIDKIIDNLSEVKINFLNNPKIKNPFYIRNHAEWLTDEVLVSIDFSNDFIETFWDINLWNDISENINFFKWYLNGIYIPLPELKSLNMIAYFARFAGRFAIILWSVNLSLQIFRWTNSYLFDSLMIALWAIVMKLIHTPWPDSVIIHELTHCISRDEYRSKESKKILLQAFLPISKTSYYCEPNEIHGYINLIRYLLHPEDFRVKIEKKDILRIKRLASSYPSLLSFILKIKNREKFIDTMNTIY